MRFSTCAVALLTLGGISDAYRSELWKNPNKYAYKRLSKANSIPAVEADKQVDHKKSRWLTSKTKKFAVDGKNIPDVAFDVGESYAGLMPISDDPHETRKLYFWFFPTTNPESHKDVTIWLNGGPGCSSLGGLTGENGPFTWEAGTFGPVKNEFGWQKLTNALWVEQPVGTGFSQGKPDVDDEVGVGKEFVGFYKQFVKTFDIKGWDLFITGESYAGMYVPYIADSFITANDSDINLKGIAINDPTIGDDIVQFELPIQPFVEYWSNVFYLNDSVTSQLKQNADKCGYTDYLAKYLTFPSPQEPHARLSPPRGQGCDLQDLAADAITDVNPCFNIYHITQTCPNPYDPLGAINEGDYTPKGSQIYFQREDVQKAIHAPVGTKWTQCGDPGLFPTGDHSDPPTTNGVLQRVIEHTNNVFVGSGNLDFLIPTNGTLLSIQNTTWHGHRGLKEYPGKDLWVPFHKDGPGSAGGSGVLGKWGAERGLTFYQVQLAGHEVPGYAATAGYRVLEALLGRIKDLGVQGPLNVRSEAIPKKFEM